MRYTRLPQQRQQQRQHPSKAKSWEVVREKLAMVEGNQN